LLNFFCCAFGGKITGTIDYSSWLTYDPGYGSSLPKVGKEVDLILANKELQDGRYDEAEKLFKKVINENITEKEANYALNGLRECYDRGKKAGFNKYLETELKLKIKEPKSDLSRQYLELNAQCLIQEGSFDEAISNLQTVLDNYAVADEYRKELLFQQGMINLVYKNNAEIGKSLFEKIKKDYQDERTKLDVDIMLAAYNNGSFAMFKNGIPKSMLKEDNSNNRTEEIPLENGLDSNYPNPFNPSTQISFTLKERTNISLKVYDVLGKEVANLADGYYEAGKHVATFNGSNLASGIYFYRLTTPTATITKKMMLVK
jgi:tetratricopeptide (TPR) repeat protein